MSADTPDSPAQPPQNPALPLGPALCYAAVALAVGLTQGLGQGMLLSNLGAIAGDLGITRAQSSWLLVCYMVPRAALPLLLMKMRTQFGLRRFAEISIALYMVVAFAAIYANDFRSALILQTLSGAAAAPLSTLTFLYMMEPLSPQWRLRLGLPVVMTIILSGTPLARIVSPELIGDGSILSLHLVTLAMSMVSLGLVYLIPVRPVPRAKVIQRLDFVSFGLIATGFTALTSAFVMGPIYNWTDAPGIGIALAVTVATLAAAAVIELNRKDPLLDIRWLTSPAILHLTATLFLFRLILSEQSSGAPGLFTVLGLAPSQMTTLFTLIFLGGIAGGLACIAWIRPQRVPQFHLAALILIMVGAYMDSFASLNTRPEQMYLSQTLIAMASLLFMPPAMITGLMAALAKGPQYLLNFIIVFISTQSLGAVIGSGLFTTFINNRQTLHLQYLSEQLRLTDPQVAQALQSSSARLVTMIADPAQRQAQAVMGVAQQASQQAYVMAYNDAYFLIFIVAALAAAALLIHRLRDGLAHRLAARATAAQTDALT
ncbi:MFS transporter [Paracoccus homiensis]|uniref:MFS transporter n=1 Tax=Paracoccus homiensis TaxID=364199 RepID=UPI00398D3589